MSSTTSATLHDLFMDSPHKILQEDCSEVVPTKFLPLLMLTDLTVVRRGRQDAARQCANEKKVSLLCSQHEFATSYLTFAELISSRMIGNTGYRNASAYAETFIARLVFPPRYNYNASQYNSIHSIKRVEVIIIYKYKRMARGTDQC